MSDDLLSSLWILFKALYHALLSQKLKMGSSEQSLFHQAFS